MIFICVFFCVVLYNNILEFSELCISFVIEIDCEKKFCVCWMSNFLLLVFFVIIIYVI